MKSKDLVVALACLCLAMSGCLQPETPTSPQTQQLEAAGKEPATIASSQQVVNGYLVRYDGRTVANGLTTFAYTVSGMGLSPELTHFAIEIPACAPALVAATPTGTTVGNDPETGLNGIKWSQSLGSSETRSYSTTYLGDVPEGLVRVGVKAGSTAGLGVLPGPCQGFFIAGTVYVDPDSSGSRDPADEPGIIANVTVTLTGGLNGGETALTDASGYYFFKVLGGSYTVQIAAATTATDFNEQLASSFAATGPTSRTVSVGPDVTNVDFGYKPNAKKIITDLETGILITTGKKRDFWIKAVRTVSRGGTYANIDATRLLGLLAQVEAAFFPDPYQFTDGNEFAEALAILTDNSRDLVDQLRSELLAAELNDAAGLGLEGETDLQDVLLSWGESLIIDRTTPSKLGNSGPIVGKGPSIDTDVQSALTVFNSLDARGGGDIPD